MPMVGPIYQELRDIEPNYCSPYLRTYYRPRKHQDLTAEFIIQGPQIKLS